MTIDVRGGLIYWIRDCDCQDDNIHVVDADGNNSNTLHYTVDHCWCTGQGNNLALLGTCFYL